MSITAIVLLLIAAFVHAGWNILGKRRNPTPASFLLANTAGLFLLAIPVLWLFGPLLPRIPPRVWWLLALTGGFQALYYGALAGAYARGQFSIAYPLARSSPIIVVTVASVVLGRGATIGWGCIAGTLLVVAGCLLLPMHRFGEFRLRNYWNLCCLLALVAATGTAGYTLIDDAGLRALRALPEYGFTALNASLVYVMAESATSSLWLGAYVACRRGDRAEFAQAMRSQKRQAVLMGAGILLAYGLVLISLAYVRNVSYASAFRQVSILIGLVAGVVFLKETMPLPRWVGALAMVVGLVLVAIG